MLIYPVVELFGTVWWMVEYSHEPTQRTVTRVWYEVFETRAEAAAFMYQMRGE